MNIKLDDPNLSFYVKSMRKLFRVTAICRDVEEANAICARDKSQAVVAESECGLIFLANRHETKVDARLVLD